MRITSYYRHSLSWIVLYACVATVACSDDPGNQQNTLDAGGDAGAADTRAEGDSVGEPGEADADATVSDTETTVASPTISPSETSFSGSLEVTMTCSEPGDEIRYTLDGTDPDDASTRYVGSFVIEATTTIQARCFRAGQAPSAATTKTYERSDDPRAVCDSLTNFDVSASNTSPTTGDTITWQVSGLPDGDDPVVLVEYLQQDTFNVFGVAEAADAGAWTATGEPLYEPGSFTVEARVWRASGQRFRCGNMSIEVGGDSIDRPASTTDLPSDYWWNRTLRDWMAGLTTSDFDYGTGDSLPKVSADGVDDLSNNQLFRVQVGLISMAEYSPGRYAAIRMSPDHFLLSNIERNGDVHMNITDVYPPIAAWWAGEFDYAGNPYYHDPEVSAALKHRALVMAAVNLSMLDAANRRGDADRQFELGGQLWHSAYPVYRTWEAAPPKVRAALEVGMVKVTNRILDKGPGADLDPGGSDLNMMAMIAMYYVYESTGEGRGVYLDYIHEVLSRIIPQAGYHRHDWGMDPGYEGISLEFMSHLAAAWRDNEITDYLARISRTKDMLTLPDKPGDMWYGPTAWAAGTSPDSAGDFHYSYDRDIRAGFYTNEARYLAFSGRRGRDGTFGSVEQMRDDVRDKIDGVNGYRFDEVTGDIGEWRPAHWKESAAYGYGLWPTGYYDTIAELAGNDMARPIHERSNDFVENVNDGNVLLAAHLGTTADAEPFSAVVHVGRLSLRSPQIDEDDNDNLKVSGFSGGTLGGYSGASGIVVLGRSRGEQSDAPDVYQDPDRGWQNWFVEGVHGLTDSDVPFATTRTEYPNYRIAVAGVDDHQLRIDGRGYADAFRDGASFTVDDQSFTCDGDATVSNGQTLVHTVEDPSGTVSEADQADIRAGVFDVDANRGSVVAVGRVGGDNADMTDPLDAIDGVVTYSREFVIDESGVQVTSNVYSDGSDNIRQLWEYVPIFLTANHHRESPTIEYSTDGGSSWSALYADGGDTYDSDLKTGVTDIRRRKPVGSDIIEFSSPQRVKLNDQLMSSDWEWAPTLVLLKIDLHGDPGTSKSMPEAASVSYSIHPAP